jgi:hypothetical protein
MPSRSAVEPSAPSKIAAPAREMRDEANLPLQRGPRHGYCLIRQPRGSIDLKDAESPDRDVGDFAIAPLPADAMPKPSKHSGSPATTRSPLRQKKLARAAREKEAVQFAQRLLRTYANPSVTHDACLHLP